MMRIALISVACLLLCGCAGSGRERIQPIGSLSGAVIAPSLTVAAPEAAEPTPHSPAPSTPAPTPQPSPSPPEAPTQSGAYIRVEKEARRLFLWKDGELLLDCSVGLGYSPAGDKEEEGDGRTPEGLFYVCSRNERSRFYLSLGLSYPNEEDAQRGLADEMITEGQAKEIRDAIADGARPPWNTPLGGEIMIHGMGGSSDWTAGCVAVDNENMDILWEHGARGTPVEILP